MENINAEDSSSPPLASSSSTISSSSSDRPVHKSVAKSQVFRRPPDLRTISSDGDAEDDEDDDSSAGFLPFASRDEGSVDAAQTSSNPAQAASREAPDPAATIRTASGGRASDRTPQMKQDVFSSNSSADSSPQTTQTRRIPLASAQSTNAAPTQAAHRATAGLVHGTGPSRMARTQSVPGTVAGRSHGAAGDRRSTGQPQGPGALSPKHRAELGRLSGRTSKEGSEGTPSMGSSFSDLDGECDLPE